MTFLFPPVLERDILLVYIIRALGEGFKTYLLLNYKTNQHAVFAKNHYKKSIMFQADKNDSNQSANICTHKNFVFESLWVPVCALRHFPRSSMFLNNFYYIHKEGFSTTKSSMFAISNQPITQMLGFGLRVVIKTVIASSSFE